MTLSEFITKLDDIAWGSVVLCLLVGVGLVLSICTRFVQFRRFGHAMKNTLGKVFKKTEAKAGEVTPLQALCTALAGTVGTGNIAGVTGAIVIGGPGAVFWMWIAAFFGMMTTHDYSLLKGIVTAILTLVGIILIIFLALVFIDIVEDIVNLVTDMFKEVSYRTY